MSHFGDYMDGVPVKISEKYKRPHRIELPYSVLECPLRVQNVVDTAKYCSTFETNVLSKLKELRNAKEIKKNERRHRLQLLQEAKQKKLDAIAAAEAEEKFKQLSVSEVSYPSTDEINALSSDDRNCDVPTTHENGSEEAEVSTSNDVTYVSCSTGTDSQLDILQPIQVLSNYPQNSLLDDPDPLQELKKNSKMVKIKYNHNVDTLTFQDFENDTSSPFDNVELKTINDMELLAQVLQSQRDSTISCHAPQPYIPQQSYVTPTNCVSQTQLEGVTYMPKYGEQPIQGPSNLYASPHHYHTSNGFYIPENTCDNAMPMDNVNMYIPNYNYYVPSQQYSAIDPTYYQNQLPNMGEINPISNDSTYIPQQYYLQYPPIPQFTPTNVGYSNIQNQVESNPSSSQVAKSRSRSVPDIVKELDEELASAKIRANERSYNVSPAPKDVPKVSSSERKGEKRSKRKSEQLPNPYDKLSGKMQIMCKNIHGMGFPLDRVARVCTLVGDNDKKVIEGLLILGELMDLGFSEGRASAALAKHEFNRDKALDELVS